jgi:hypothetical protein
MRPSDFLGLRASASVARLSLCSLILLTILTAPGLADAPTHKLTLSARTTHKYDCGVAHGVKQCSDACVVAARLANLNVQKPVPIEVAIWFKNDNTDAGESDLSFRFDALGIKEKMKQPIVNEAPSYTCDKVQVKRIEVSCPDGQDGKCPSFVYVSVPDVKVLRIKHQNIDGK